MLALAVLTLAAPPSLPPAWHGAWAGTLHVTPAAGEPTTVAMSLVVKPLAGGRLTWTLTYGDGDKKDIRRYELVPGDKPGRFVIDEKNGITLPARLTGDTLVGLFQVGDRHLHTRHHLTGGVIRYELTTFAPDPTAGGPGVTAYRPAAVQTAELKRTD